MGVHRGPIFPDQIIPGQRLRVPGSDDLVVDKILYGYGRHATTFRFVDSTGKREMMCLNNQDIRSLIAGPLLVKESEL